MVQVFIKDSGRISIPYDGSEAAFTYFTDTAPTQQKKRQGEFRVEDPIELKLTSFSPTVQNNTQVVSGLTDMRTLSSSISKSPLLFNCTCTVNKPRNTFTDTTDLKDLDTYTKILLLQWSKGYKQFWIEDTPNKDREKLFTLYNWISLFGVNDASTTYGTTVSGVKKHLKVLLNSFTQQEGVDQLTYQMTFEVKWDF